LASVVVELGPLLIRLNPRCGRPPLAPPPPPREPTPPATREPAAAARPVAPPPPPRLAGDADAVGLAAPPPPAAPLVLADAAVVVAAPARPPAGKSALSCEKQNKVTCVNLTFFKQRLDSLLVTPPCARNGSSGTSVSFVY